MRVRAEEEEGIPSLVVEGSVLAGGSEIDVDIPPEAYTINMFMVM
jgi:hypothetical protein